MKLKLIALQARMAEKLGHRVSVAEIANDIGISPATLFNLGEGRMAQVRGEYIDVLAAYSGMTPNELIEVEPAHWPIAPIRPDRKGVRVGDITKKRTRAKAVAG